MTEPDVSRIREAISQAFRKVAPEADLSTIDPAAPIRDQIDIDSMDQLNVFVRLHQSLGVEIPEADYGRLATLDGMIAYLNGKLSSGRGSSSG